MKRTDTVIPLWHLPDAELKWVQKRRVAAILGSYPIADLTPAALVARRQRLLRAVLADVHVQRLHTLDAELYRAMRTPLLAAGAAPADLAAIATWLVQMLVDDMLAQASLAPEDVLDHLALLQDHLVGEVFDVCLDPETGQVLRLEFPNRPTTH